MTQILKFLALVVSAFSGFKKLCGLVNNFLVNLITRRAIDKGRNEKDTSDIERIINK